MSILSWEAAIELRTNRKLVFTNGVFDLLHAGHVGYLESARELGDLLIVGLNTDRSARALGKGPHRPVNSLEDRAAVVGALRCVDAVVAFDEATPEAVIRALRPEFHVKGGDYTAEMLPETPIVRAFGGQVVILPFLAGRSTSKLLEKLDEA